MYNNSLREGPLKDGEREGIIIYEYTSHPSNIRNMTAIGLLLIHLK